MLPSGRIVWLDLPVRSSVPTSFTRDLDNLMLATGENTGNLVFRKGLESIVDVSLAQVADPHNADEIIYGHGEPPSLVLISCANWIGEGNTYEESNFSRSEILSRKPLPILPIGLAIQAATGAQPLNLGENTRRLLSILADSSSYISVRCNKTADCLKSLGIGNVIVTGCPSNFISDLNFLQKSFCKRLDYLRSAGCWQDLRLVINEPPEGVALEQPFLASYAELASFFVLQTASGISDIRFHFHNTKLHRVSKRFPPSLRRKATYFFDVDSWLEHSYSCDAVIGHRMHANMIGLQAGVPSLLVVHDARIQGLADTMCIPIITNEESLAIATAPPSVFADIFEQQVTAYLDRRLQLSDKFLELFSAV